MALMVPTEHRRLNEFVGLLLLTAAILIALSLVSFDPADPSFNLSRNPQFNVRPNNFVGMVGSHIADGMFQILGYASFLIPVFLGVHSFYWIASWTIQSFGIRLLGMFFMVATVSASLSLSPSLPFMRDLIPAGGAFGKLLAQWLEASLNPPGTIVVLIAAFLISLLLSTTFSLTTATQRVQARFRFATVWLKRWRDWRAERENDKGAPADSQEGRR